MSLGSGVTDFTDSAATGDAARDFGYGGFFAANAVKGYIPYLENFLLLIYIINKIKKEIQLTLRLQQIFLISLRMEHRLA